MPSSTTIRSLRASSTNLATSSRRMPQRTTMQHRCATHLSKDRLVSRRCPLTHSCARLIASTTRIQSMSRRTEAQRLWASNRPSLYVTRSRVVIPHSPFPTRCRSNQHASIQTRLGTNAISHAMWCRRMVPLTVTNHSILPLLDHQGATTSSQAMAFLTGNRGIIRMNCRCASAVMLAVLWSLVRPSYLAIAVSTLVTSPKPSATKIRHRYNWATRSPLSMIPSRSKSCNWRKKKESSTRTML